MFGHWRKAAKVPLTPLEALIIFGNEQKWLSHFEYEFHASLC